MNNTLVSVVIPCRNEEKYIKGTIFSIFNQKDIDGDIEVIIVDGMSNDNTKQIISEIQKEYKNIKLIENKKKITPVAMNLGIKAAKGMYIAIMGAHAQYDPRYLCNSIYELRNRAGVACAGGPIHSSANSNFGKATAIAMSHPVGVGNAKHRFPNYEGFAEGACFPVFKKEVFETVGLYDERLVKNQDDEFNFRLTKKGYKIYLTKRAKCVYYVRDSISELFKQYFNYGFWRVAVIKKHKLPVSFRQVVPVLFLLSILTFIILSPFLPFNSAVTALVIPVLYLSILFILSIEIIKKYGFKVGKFFPLAVSILHVSYGLGFIKGAIHLLKFKKV